MAAEPRNDVHDFHEQLKAILPRLRIYALSLTRDRDAADDLVHDTVIKALTGRHSFQPGTNLAAWLFRIQRNEFISGLRRQRPSVPVDTAIAESLSQPAHQDSGLIMREFLTAFAKLVPTQREALLKARPGRNRPPASTQPARTIARLRPATRRQQSPEHPFQEGRSGVVWS